MAQDIFLLTTDNEVYSTFKENYPAIKLLPYDEINEDSLSFIMKTSLTGFFYIVKTDDNMLDSFDFGFKPLDKNDNSIHIWDSRDTVRLYNKSCVKKDIKSYVETQFQNGSIKITNHSRSLIDKNRSFYSFFPQVYILCQSEKIGKKYSDGINANKNDIHVITANNGLTKDVLNHILSSSKSEFFYVVDSRTKILNSFDFRKNLANKWDYHYSHVWNMCRGVRLMNISAIEQNISLYTDEAWDKGETPLKNHDDIVFDMKESDHEILSLTNPNKTKIVVLGDDFECNHIEDDRLIYIRHGQLNRTSINDILEKVDTEFFYVVEEGSRVNDEFNFTFMPEDRWDIDFIHIWKNDSKLMFFNKAMVLRNIEIFTDNGLNFEDHLFKNHDDEIVQNVDKWQVFDSLDHAKCCKDAYFFILHEGCKLIDGFDLSFKPAQWDKNKIHYWQRLNPYTNKVFDYSGLELHPNGVSEARQYVKSPGCIAMPYDIVFISYKERYADENYEKLLRIAPDAKRVDGVKGIYEAHKQAAEVATTKMFYVVDADAEILPEFDFSFMPRSHEEHKVFVWRSKNPINDLVYGYGGIKLFPRTPLLESTEYKIDFTTSIVEDFVPIAQISNVTKFNTDPFNTWKSSFRECVKLASKLIDGQNDIESENRLSVWCTKIKDKDFSEYAYDGAICGKRYGLKYKNNNDKLRMINDYEWLFKEFEKREIN